MYFSSQAACMHAYVLGTCPYSSGSSTCIYTLVCRLPGWFWVVSPCEDAKGMQMWGWQRRSHRKPVQGAQTTSQSEASCPGLEPQGMEGQEGPGLLSSTSLGVMDFKISVPFCSLSGQRIAQHSPLFAYPGPYEHVPAAFPQLSRGWQLAGWEERRRHSGRGEREGAEGRLREKRACPLSFPRGKQWLEPLGFNPKTVLSHQLGSLI